MLKVWRLLQQPSLRIQLSNSNIVKHRLHVWHRMSPSGACEALWRITWTGSCRGSSGPPRSPRTGMQAMWSRSSLPISKKLPRMQRRMCSSSITLPGVVSEYQNFKCCMEWPLKAHLFCWAICSLQYTIFSTSCHNIVWLFAGNLCRACVELETSLREVLSFTFT